MNSTVWIKLATTFAAASSAQSGAKIAGVVTVTRECDGRGVPLLAEHRLARRSTTSRWALDPLTFDAYLKPAGSGLVFHFYQARNKVRGEEMPFTVAGPSANMKPGFELWPK